MMLDISSRESSTLPSESAPCSAAARFRRYVTKRYSAAEEKLLLARFRGIESYAVGTARAVGGELTITFKDAEQADKVQPGMELEVGDVTTEVLAVGVEEDGTVIASAQANIPDGMYDIRVGYNTTQVISMLIN